LTPQLPGVKTILIFIFDSCKLPIVLVCHCKGLSDREIHRAIRAGACTRREVARECGAGSICGGCRPLIDELLEHRNPASAGPGFELAAAS
jgi:bacterioferritin-associated ferredoxin